MTGKRLAVTLPLAVACAAGAVLAIADVRTPLRTVLAPLFLAVVPGAGVAGLLRGHDPLTTLAVAGASSLAINIIVAEAMLIFDVWSYRAGVVTVGILGLFLFVLRLIYRGGASAAQRT